MIDLRQNEISPRNELLIGVSEMQFKGLPFNPERNQVIYIENGYDEEVNDYIRNHYSELKSVFGAYGIDFIYMPYLFKEKDVEAKVRYYAPYLSTKRLVNQIRSDVLVSYLSDAEAKDNLKPSFIFNGKPDDYWGNFKFTSVSYELLKKSKKEIVDRLINIVTVTLFLDGYDEGPSSSCSCSSEPTLERLSRRKSGEKNEASSRESILTGAQGLPSMMPSDYEACGDVDSYGDDETSNSLLERLKKLLKPREKALKATSDIDEQIEFERAENKSITETEKVLSELNAAVQKLRLSGVSLMAIHEFIDKQEPLSRMTVTPDYRIFLPDYNNMEIEMGALPKAIYFLFLRYPEGIVYKYMPDYFNELLNIYRQLRPNTDETRLQQTISKVVNPLSNALNENIARIRKAFVEKFDEHLAKNYIITGERGAEYRILLNRDLITWEE